MTSQKLIFSIFSITLGLMLSGGVFANSTPLAFAFVDDRFELNQYSCNAGNAMMGMLIYVDGVPEPSCEPEADLAVVSLTGEPDLSDDVGNVDFDAKVANLGPDTAENVIVSFVGSISTGLPTSPDITLVSVCDIFENPGCTVEILNPGECIELFSPPGTSGYRCNVGDMKPCEMLTFDIRSALRSGATGDHSLTVSVTSDTTDPDPDNNSKSLTVNDPGQP